MSRCPNCGDTLGRTTGVSSLYNPGPHSIVLCEDCWLDEEDLIDQEGTNSGEYSNLIKEKLIHYKRNGG